MSKRNIYIVGGGSEYANWMQGEEVFKMKDADLVLFTGGEDVCPKLYGKKIHPTTSFNSRRDKFEVEEFELAKSLSKPMIGICRGAQFLCVMNGGILVQHQDNPFFIHKIFTFDKKEIAITSTHHQAAYPFDLPKSKYKLLGWTNGISQSHYGQTWFEEMSPSAECEVVYYPEFCCLGIQGHPEILYGRENYQDSINYFRDLLNKQLAHKL